MLFRSQTRQRWRQWRESNALHDSTLHATDRRHRRTSRNRRNAQRQKRYPLERFNRPNRREASPAHAGHHLSPKLRGSRSPDRANLTSGVQLHTGERCRSSRCNDFPHREAKLRLVHQGLTPRPNLRPLGPHASLGQQPAPLASCPRPLKNRSRRTETRPQRNREPWFPSIPFSHSDRTCHLSATRRCP